MTNFFVRSHLDTQVPTNADIVLDLIPGSAGTLSVNVADIDATIGQLPTLSEDLVRLGAAVYAADKLAPRTQADDAWSRDLKISLPLHERRLFDEASDALSKGLKFLTQDDWRLLVRTERRRARHEQLLRTYDAVSLFSGGLDSLVGAIDLLESDTRSKILLVGHYDATSVSSLQRYIRDGLVNHYGASRIGYLGIRVQVRNSKMAAYKLPIQREKTTRSRSFLFLCIAIACANAVAADTPVYVPENGFIALNVPLGSDRMGSCSTRTTHPFFFHLLKNAFGSLGIRNPIRNPYLYLTKGQMLDACRNQPLLRRLEGFSVSCAHPDQRRYEGTRTPNCGYCYPCLIRRASLHHVGRDRAGKADYRKDVCRTDAALIHERNKGRDVRAVLQALRDGDSPLAIMRNGPLPMGQDLQALSDMHRSGIAELRQLFNDKAVRLILAYAGI